MPMNSRNFSLLLLAALVLIGCASPDMTSDASLSQSDRQLATRVAERARQACTTHTYEQGNPEQKRSGDARVSALPTIRKLYRSDSGWVKVEMIANGVWDNLFLLERTGAVVCGELGWQKFANSNSIVFREIGKQDRLLPTDSSSTAPTTSRPPPTKQEETRSIALRWDGYPRLISGTVSLMQGDQRGVVRALLPGSDGTCSGVFEYTSTKFGQWAISCTNGLSATGTVEALETGKALTGLGRDIKGNRVEFTVAGTP